MYYTVPDVANMLGVNNETARRWIREGKIKAKRNMGRGGNEVLLKDVVAFANQPPKSFLGNLVVWLNEHNIPYETIPAQNKDSSIKNEEKSIHPVTTDFPDTVCDTAAMAATMLNPFVSIAAAPMLIGAKAAAKGRRKKAEQNYDIKLLSCPEKDETIENVELSSFPCDNNDALPDDSHEKIESAPPFDSTSQNIDDLIRREQMNLIRLRQELAQIQAKITVAEGQIEYYKLLK